MVSTYQVLEHKDISSSLETRQVFATDIFHGLSQNPKVIPPKYFYDDEGSKIFIQITKLTEYYLTKCESEILENQKKNIADLVSKESFNLIELGPGDGQKTNILLDYFLKSSLDFKYVPIDISESTISGLINLIKQKFPKLETNGLVSEYFNGIKWLGQNGSKRNFVLFLGSTIGNFYKPNKLLFLRSLWNALNHNDLVLIGFDLKKDIDLMLKAYNDSKGITSKFNLNLLKRINYELEANFDLNKFRFYANYNPITGAVESFLISTEEQSVYIKYLEQTFHFNAWEPIHTEYSYKYLDSDIEALASETGYKVEMKLYDSKKHFTDYIWRVQKVIA